MNRVPSGSLPIRFACLLLFASGAAATGAPRAPEPRLLLVTPGENRRIQSGSVLFSWKVQGGDSVFKADRYELQIWERKKRFKRSVRVEPRDTSGYAQFLVYGARQWFRRHGKYHWKVIAEDSAGRQLVSAASAFVVPPPKLGHKITRPAYPFAVRFQYNHWSQFNPYRSFVSGAYPRSHLQSYSEIGFGFRQAWGEDGAFELRERLLLLSQAGLGGEIRPSLRALQNGFIELCPWLRLRHAWNSTGLKQYSGTVTDVALGIDCSIMPGGSLTLSAAWVPAQTVRYGLENGGLRSLEGSGFEAGFCLRVPRSLCSTIRLAGTDIDLQRFPLGVAFGRVRDDYTGVRLDYRRLTLEYLF